MTLQEIEKLLPNGFHDTLVHSIEINYECKQAIFTITPLEDEEHKNGNQPFKLILTGLYYLSIDPPSLNYPFQKKNSLRIDLCDEDKDFSLIKTINEPTFSGRFFAYDWNSFIHVAAENAELRTMLRCAH
jgi:hypothetical protein